MRDVPKGHLRASDLRVYLPRASHSLDSYCLRCQRQHRPRTAVRARARPCRVAGRSLVVADLTGDGRLDVVTNSEGSPDSQSAYRLYLWAGTAGGGLEERARLATSQPATVGIDGLATADLTDGRADVAFPTGAGIDLFFQRAGG